MKDFLKNGVPVKTRFWDGTVRRAPRCIHKLFRKWRRYGDRIEESGRVFGAYRGGDVIDVGAFRGWYAALLAPRARAGDTLLCMEPDPRAYVELLRNIAALSSLFPRVRFCALPLSAGDGSAVKRTVPTRDDRAHPRYEPARGGGTERSLTLDELSERWGLRPAFLKIDVEGAEIHVLRGARRLLREGDLKVMVELHPRFQPEDVTVDDVMGEMTGAGFAPTPIRTEDGLIRHIWSK